MILTNGLPTYLAVNLLLGSVCLFANGEQTNHEQKTTTAKNHQEQGKNEENSPTIAPESRMRVGVKGHFSHDVIVYYRENLPTETHSGGRIGTTPAFGFGAIFEYPFYDFLSVGAQFDTKFIRSNELMHFDIDAFVKMPFTLGFTHPISNFYFSAPLGLSLGRFSSNRLKLGTIPKGMNAGILFGKEFFFAQRFGILIEAGYGYRYLGAKTSSGKEFSMHFHELAANVGFTFGF